MQEKLDEIFQAVVADFDENPKELIAVVGPTCTGKTDLAISLAKHYGCEIINADSRLIFQEMNIGTAKPSEAELAEVPHHLVNILSPEFQYSAAKYQKDFDQVFIEISRQRQDYPKAIVVGGTGLYLRTALENLDMPDVGANQELRDQIKSKFNTEGLTAIVDELLEKDPGAAALVDLKNHVRVMRALETVILAGKPLAELRKKLSKDRYDVAYYGLNFESRRKLYDLINKRVIIMSRRGLVHEVEALLNKYGQTNTILGTIGYSEICEYLSGEGSLSASLRKIQKNTRRYAKKQMTWFKSNRKIKWFFR